MDGHVFDLLDQLVEARIPGGDARLEKRERLPLFNLESLRQPVVFG